MFGLGKRRTALGEWLDRRGIKQEWLVSKTKLGRTTISNACGDTGYIPSGSSIQKIIKALREVDPSIRADQFWDL
ncbi:transcriptional regulator [Paenibacillus lautus]